MACVQDQLEHSALIQTFYQTQERLEATESSCPHSSIIPVLVAATVHILTI